MIKLKHFLWYCSLTTGGIMIGFVTFMQSMWQLITIWPYYEQTDHYIDNLKFEPLKEIFQESHTILFTFCGIWAIFILANVVSAAMLVYGTTNVSLKYN